MEKRSSDRHKTGDQYKGKVILADKITIKDISLTGIRLESIENLTPNNIYRIEITSRDNEKITPLGEVVWSFLMRTVSEKNRTMSIYGVGLKFIELTDDEKHSLEENLNELVK